VTTTANQPGDVRDDQVDRGVAALAPPVPRPKSARFRGKEYFLPSASSALVDRYDMGTRVRTLALVLVSVTILANRSVLFWIGSFIAAIGAFIAIGGYFAFI
jgi:hypothetical protein